MTHHLSFSRCLCPQRLCSGSETQLPLLHEDSRLRRLGHLCPCRSQYRLALSAYGLNRLCLLEHRAPLELLSDPGVAATFGYPLAGDEPAFGSLGCRALRELLSFPAVAAVRACSPDGAGRPLASQWHSERLAPLELPHGWMVAAILACYRTGADRPLATV